MIRKNELVVMKAIALCYKKFLKPEEARVYTNLARTQFNKQCEEWGVYKNSMGYYNRDDLDRMLAGETVLQEAQKAKK